MYIYMIKRGHKMALTEKQHRFLQYLTDRLAQDGRAPSLRRAATDIGVTHTAVAQMLGQLEKKGLVERGGRYSRSIHLVSAAPVSTGSARGRELPVIGRITAGLPMYAQQTWDETVVVDHTLFAGDNLFCLRVSGESMRGAGILDGDLVICEPRQYAENGEIVAVLIHGDEATVKRFFLHSDHIELRPENDAFPVMRYSFRELLIQGKVIGVIRGRSSEFTAAGKKAI
jgi:repressor LexA